MTEADIQTLKLNDKIRIDNSWWNINKVIDYDANAEVPTKVELISIDTEIELAPFVTNPGTPVSPPITASSHESNLETRSVEANVNLSDTVAEPYIRTRANMKVGFTHVNGAQIVLYS